MTDEPIPCGGCGATDDSQRCIGCLHDFGTKASGWVRSYGAKIRESRTVEVPKGSLLKVVRKLDLDAAMSQEEFAAAFDDLRAAFTPEEIATGEL